MFKPGLSVTAASLGNKGIIEARNQFDVLEVSEGGWEYQSYELAGSRRRPKRRRKVVKCAQCVCSVCCALGICSLSCPHGQTLESAVESGSPLRQRTAAEHREYLTRQVEEDFIRHGYRGRACAPKCSSVALAVAAANKIESDSAAKTALTVIAETKAFLDVSVVVECPNGEEIVTIARLDTGANTDVVAPKLAQVLKMNKVPWSTKGGAFVEVCGASSVRPTGFLSVPIAVSARQLGLPRRLHLEIDACVMDIPGQDEASGPGMLLGLPSLLDSGLLAAVVMGASIPSQVAADNNLDLDPVGPWEDLGRDDPGLRVGTAQSGEIVMPTVGGTDAEQAAIWNVLNQYRHVLGPPPVGGSKLRPMSIELRPGVMIPKPAPARRVSPDILTEIRADTELRIRNGWMRKTVVGDKCRFASPVVAARQPGKTARRICGDYRAINDICLLHQAPVKDAREVTAQFKGAKYFGKADMYKGYFQLRLDEAAQELLAIRTPDALYYPLTLPFGPASGPAQFQQRVTEVLGDLEGHGVASYIDDLGLYATTFEEYLQRLQTMLERLDAYDIRLNGGKCQFGQKSMDFLGHRVSERGVEHTPERIEAVKNMAVPQTRTQLRSFLGMLNYFRDSIPLLGPTVVSLSRLAGPKGKGAFKKGEWQEQHQQAFEAAKAAIAGARLLSYLDYSLPIRLRTDACDDGAGAMLYQVVDGQDRPVAFMSHTFSAAERRWSTYEQEAFGVVKAVTHFDSLLLGHPFVVETDHKNLCFLYKSDNPKVVRWRTRLSEYTFEVVHIAGVDNPVADALSRCHPVHVSVAGSVDSSQVAGAVKRVPGGLAERPASLDDAIVKTIQYVHGEVAGHRQVQATIDKLLRAGYNRPNLQREVEYVVGNCGFCQKVADRRQDDDKSQPRFNEIVEVGEEWSLDTIGPLPEDEDGNTYILVAIDGFSRFVVLEPAADASGESVANFLLKLVGWFGRPKGIRTDGGSQYDNHLIDVFCNLLGLDRHVTLAYRPQANGRVERVNKEVGRHLRYICLDRRFANKWSKMLPLVQRSLNTQLHQALGVEPARIVFGGFQTMDRFLLPDTVPGAVQQGIAAIPAKERRLVVGEYVQHLIETQNAIVKCAQEYQHKYIKSRARRVAAPPVQPFKEGDWVLAQWQGLPHGRTRPTKLSPCWRGPFSIVAVDALTQQATLRDPTDMLIMKPDVHWSQLRQYRMGLTSESDLMDLRAMDTAEDVIVQFVEHEMHYPNGAGGRLRLLPRSQWRFKAEFSDGSTRWMLWAEANQMAALDVYAAKHKLKLPAIGPNVE